MAVSQESIEDWALTGRLRYERQLEGCYLQQEWGSQSGKREWRDVP